MTTEEGPPLNLAAEVVDLIDQVLELEAQLRAIRLQSALTTNAYTALLGAARASVTAAETGRPDPLRPLLDELPEHRITRITTPTQTPRGPGERAVSPTYGPAPAPAVEPRRTAA